MNDLITDIKSLEIETLKNLKNSKANNTLRAYQSDFKDFSAFCAKNGLSSIPTQPKIIAIYITHLSKSSKFSTLKRRIASISVIHKLKGHYLDTKHPIIMENLQLSNSCVNCENILTNSLCSFHNVEVSEKYTCSDFEKK